MKSSASSSSSSESEAFVSETTRGDSLNGASSLKGQFTVDKRDLPRHQCLLFVLSLLLEFIEFQLGQFIDLQIRFSPRFDSLLDLP